MHTQIEIMYLAHLPTTGCGKQNDYTRDRFTAASTCSGGFRGEFLGFHGTPLWAGRSTKKY